MTMSIVSEQELIERATASIAQGKLTNSKRSSVFIKGIYPEYITRGHGCYLYDTKGIEYIDFICGLGSVLFGYCDPSTEKAIVRQMQFGITHSLATPLEITVAEKLKDIIPCIDLVKFTKTGTEACMAAIRIARAYQDPKGKMIIYSEGYHGWGDEFIALSPPALGIQDEFCFLRKLEDMSNYDDDDFREIAAIIVEPIITALSEERIEWLRRLRKLCTEKNIVLIFDEVITGFRFPKFSVSKFLGIDPDIIVLGKALGNGMPISVVGGKREIMNCGEYFVSGTFYGETLSLAAAYNTITELHRTRNINQLWESGSEFLKAFNSIWPEMIRLEGYPTRSALAGDAVIKALFMQEACKAGYLVGPSFFIGFQHMSVLSQARDAFRDIILRIKSGNVKLEGEMPKSPFAQQQREKA